MLEALTFDADEEGQLLWEASRKASLPPLGRVLDTIFASECREVEKVLSPHNVRGPQGSVGLAVNGLLQHVDAGLQIGALLHQVLLPLLEHAVNSRDHSNRRKIVLLLRWFFTKTKSRVLLAKSLATVVDGLQGDHRVKLGWSVVVRELLVKEPLLYEASPAEEGSLQTQPPLMSFSTCLKPLVQIVCTASVKEGKRRAPTRLTMAAADCAIVITKSLVSNIPSLSTQTEQPSPTEVQEKKSFLIRPTSSRSSIADVRRERNSLDSDSMASTSGGEHDYNKEKGERALWDNLDDMILLVTELYQWNEKGRSLHARGLQQVQKRLRLLAEFRDSLQAQGEEGQNNITVGVSVMAACWRQYSGLILLEDRTLSSHPEPTIDHWLGALQYWTQKAQEMEGTEMRRADEMRGYALTCLALVLGRLDSRRLETVLEGFESQLFQSLMNQVRGGDHEAVDLAMAIMRALLFRTSAATIGDDSSRLYTVNSKMEDIVPVLMDMLDARDSTARAVVLLVAEFFALHPESHELEKLFARLDSEESVQRRNALDVLAEVVSSITKSIDNVDSTLSRTIANHLFERLGDEELTNRVEASSIFAKLDPMFTLGPLMRLMYSPDGRKRSAASSAVNAVLKGNSNHSNAIIVLLDCLRDLVEEDTDSDKRPAKVPAGVTRKEGASVDVDRVLSLIPSWASMVQDWPSLINVLLDKMYAEASNPVIPRFLSYISVQLSDTAHVVFPHVYQRMHEQPKMSEDLLDNLNANKDNELSRLLFQRLSPMLVLRVLPLQAFNYSNSVALYNSLLSDDNSGFSGEGEIATADSTSCITTLLLERMCGRWEFDDVRKVASELTGRLLPNAMLPLVVAVLEEAAVVKDTLKAKSCLYSLCTSLMIRGRESLDHPMMERVQQLLSIILLWSEGSKEILKAQHGCIDCIAAMICAEVGTIGIVHPSPSSPSPGPQKPKRLIEEIPEDQWESRPSRGDRQKGLFKQWKILSAVIDCLRGRHRLLFSASGDPEQGDEGMAVLQSLYFLRALKHEEEVHPAPEAFRLCMANVLISCSQKVSSSARPEFAKTVLPAVMNYIQVGSEPKVREACIQVLFTSVYYLNGPAVLPFAVDLLTMSISIIGDRRSPEERIAGTKLLASLLASEEDLLKDMAPFLEDARRAVATVANMDASPQLRALCEQLLACMTPTQ